MKVLMCSINFSPELTGIGKYSGEMAEWLCGRGHHVRVITAPPHYPHWKVDDAYSSWRFRKEQRTVPPLFGLLEVYRCPLWVPRVPHGLKRVLHLLSFSLSTWPVILRNICWKPDVVLLIAPTLFCSPQILCAAFLSRAVSWLHIQDFELDAAFELNDFSSNALRSVSERIERVLIRKFERGSSISMRMQERLMRKGIHPSRCVLFPNWVDTSLIFPMNKTIPLRQELGIPEDKVIALYSGSMGKKHGLEFLLEASKRVAAQSNIQFVFCGDGPGRQSIMRFAAHASNVMLLPLQPLTRLNELLNIADVHLLPQVVGAADLVMPSKLTGMMASGRAILATAEPGTQLFEVLSQKGVVVPPGDVEAFAGGLMSLATNSEKRKQLGRSAREYAIAQFKREYVLSQFEGALIEACESRSFKVRYGLELPIRERSDAQESFVTREVGDD